jgi:hypothetical protein
VARNYLNITHVCSAGHREVLAAAIPLFIELLQDSPSDSSVQFATASALVKLANHGALHEFSSTSLTRDTVDLREAISAAIPTLVDLIHRDFAFHAISMLGQYGASYVKLSVLY